MNEDDAPDISQLVRDYMENRIEMEKLRTESYQIRRRIYDYKKNSGREENQEFKQTNPEIFEQKPTSSPEEPGILTGGVTETYRVKDKTGKVKLTSKDISSNMVQDFYEIDRETIGKSLAFTLTMDKISAGLIGAYQSSDQVIAFNNNILAEVTNFYLKPGIALKDNQKDKFQKDYQKWYLEKEIGKEFPSGEPRLKEQPKEEIVEEEVVEEEVVS